MGITSIASHSPGLKPADTISKDPTHFLIPGFNPGASDQTTRQMETITDTMNQVTWHMACYVDDIPEDGGGCAFISGKQIAIYNFARRGEWYATDNQCPHRQQMALSRGMIGSHAEEPKVACPFHKKTFSLQTGQCLNDDEYRINTFPVMVKENRVYVGL